MSRRDKAAQLLSRLIQMHRPIVFKNVEDIEYGCSKARLNFYFFWIVKGGKN